MVISPLWDALAAVERYAGLSRLFPNGSNAILMYHAVNDKTEYGNVSEQRFRSELNFLTERYNIVDLPAVVESNGQNSKKIAITFDDGFESFLTEVVPLLREFEVPATVFVVADEIVGRETNLNATATLDSQQVRSLIEEDLVTIGNHSKTHPYLSEVTGKQLYEEIVTAQQYLEREFDISIDRFCYPSGDVSTEALSMVRKSHKFATTTRPALVTPETDPHLLPRIDAYQSADRVRWELTDFSEALRRMAEQFGLIDSDKPVDHRKT